MEAKIVVKKMLVGLKSLSQKEALAALIHPRTGIALDETRQEWEAVAFIPDDKIISLGRCSFETDILGRRIWEQQVWGELILASGGPDIR